MSYSNHLSGDGSSPNNAVCEMAWQKMDCSQAIAGTMSWLQRRRWPPTFVYVIADGGCESSS